MATIHSNGFGGKVNAKHLIAYKGWDDEFDTDYGYQGKASVPAGCSRPLTVLILLNPTVSI